MATSFHRTARCPHIRLKEGGEDLMLTGGLLPFPRTGCVLYAKAILSYCSLLTYCRLNRPAVREELANAERAAKAIQEKLDGNDCLVGLEGLEPSTSRL